MERERVQYSRMTNNHHHSSSSYYYYVVLQGRQVGIFDHWEACAAQTNQYPKAQFCSFATRGEAEAFWKDYCNATATNNNNNNNMNSNNNMNNNNDDDNSSVVMGPEKKNKRPKLLWLSTTESSSSSSPESASLAAAAAAAAHHHHHDTKADTSAAVVVAAARDAWKSPTIATANANAAANFDAAVVVSNENHQNGQFQSQKQEQQQQQQQPDNDDDDDDNIKVKLDFDNNPYPITTTKATTGDDDDDDDDGTILLFGDEGGGTQTSSKSVSDLSLAAAATAAAAAISSSSDNTQQQQQQQSQSSMTDYDYNYDSSIMSMNAAAAAVAVAAAAAQGHMHGSNHNNNGWMNTTRNNNNFSSKPEKYQRISEILHKNLTVALQQAKEMNNNNTNTNNNNTSGGGRHHDEQQQQQLQMMQGDIPQLGLHQSFFVQGIKVGWPYPAIMTPQRQMCFHVITGLKRGRHVVLESPTGTGKSAALLCSVLAWQRYHIKTTTTMTATMTTTTTQPTNETNKKNNNKPAAAAAAAAADNVALKLDVAATKMPEQQQQQQQHLATTASVATAASAAAVVASKQIPKIYYCSRTHSQVAQMVASLKKTPYRPRMAVLGSRDRLCIHRHVKPRDGTTLARPVNANLACQIRVRNTEKIRKSMLDRNRSSLFQTKNWNPPKEYDDESPPLFLPGDGDGRRSDFRSDDTTTGGGNNKHLTCPHYRQLTTTRTARLLQERFAPSVAQVSCCKTGGEHTKLGAADIEDLVAFGMNPYQHSTSIYRHNNSFGLSLEQNEKGGTSIAQIKGSATQEGTLKPGDRILRINGRDMRRQDLTTVADVCRQSSDPLHLQVVSQNAPSDDDDNLDGTYYSEHAACPYYMSRALAKHAEIVFTPYNYLLDPTIREAMGIDLSDAVVVLDEAHNVEDTLRDSGSGRFGEFELCELIAMLEYHSRGSNRRKREEDREETDETRDIAHELLLFLESIVRYMQSSRQRFEKNPGNSGAQAAIRDWKKFHTPDDKEFEIDYFGPTGSGKNGKPVGCRPFFELLGVENVGGDHLLKAAKELENRFVGDKSSEDGRTTSSLYDRLVDLIAKLNIAMNSPEHFYISCGARANGSLAYAANEGEEADQEESPRFRRKSPKKLPYIRPRSDNNRDAPVPQCYHDACAMKGTVFHGDFCDGSVTRWEAVLALELLTPSLLLRPVADQCRSLILASGSLAPLGSLCAELGLCPASDDSDVEKKKSNMIPSKTEKQGRLQVKPQPLEAGHVITLERQLCAVSIGSFPDGSPLTVTYAQYKKPGFYAKLGEAIASVVESIPRGGVLCFLPSYTFLKNCMKTWNPEYGQRSRYGGFAEDGEIWDRLERSKGTIVIEPTGSQAEFEAAKARFTESIRRDKKALLFAVFRGKMSEGISFNDDNARGVICVGLPFPNSYDRTIKAKQLYNDEQRKLCGNTNLLPGMEWYSQQAYRAIAQALGRCVRHAGDYGTVILMDSRHCDDGAPMNGICRAHRNLPKWMRSNVRNLSMSNHPRHGHYCNPPIYGGYAGLSAELRNFFANAKQHSESVVLKLKQDFAKAQALETGTEHSFDNSTGTWTQTPQGKR